MIDRLLRIIDSYYALDEIDVGKFSQFKARGVRFSLKSYEAEGLGHVSTLQGEGVFGLFKREVVIITPLNLDLPLYTYDRVRFLGIDKLIVEMYNTILSDFCSQEMHRVKKNYSTLKERGSFSHFFESMRLPSSFHKKSWFKRTRVFDKMTMDHFAAYLSASNSKLEDIAEKKEKTSFFVEGFLESGGPATDFFMRKYGAEKTSLLYKKYIFGIEK